MSETYQDKVKQAIKRLRQTEGAEIYERDKPLDEC